MISNDADAVAVGASRGAREVLAEQTRPPVFDPALVRTEPDGRYSLIGWRCSRCGRLAFGTRNVCPLCGFQGGRETRLSSISHLETWTRVVRHEGDYVVGYCLIGDGEDKQEVRVFGPIDVSDERLLSGGQPLEIRFDTSEIGGLRRVHHVLTPRGS